MWGELSDARTGLSFRIAAGPRQRSHFRVRLPWGSWPYITVSDSKRPFSSPPTTRRATVEVFDTASKRELSLTLLNWILLYNHFVLAKQKTQPLYCWKGVFTAPLQSNGSYSIVACLFVAAGMFTESLSSNERLFWIISAFGRHITIRSNWCFIYIYIYTHDDHYCLMESNAV
jgi:hypothetical protein